MLSTVRVRKSGNSLMFPLTKELREVIDIDEGDKLVIEITPTGFIANKVNARKPELVLPMTCEQLTRGAQPDDENLLPIEEMHFD
jgi:antitoxin component of MazEF toxin-antitoxin module